MAKIIMLLGDEGTGKTTSLESLPPEQTVIIKSNNKPLPWRGSSKMYNKEKKNLIVSNELNAIEPTVSAICQAPQIKYIVIDDFFHTIAHEVLSPVFLARTDGGEAFQRYTDLAAAIYQALFEKEDTWRDDVFLIITNHTQIEENGMEVFKSPGKLLEKDIKPASYVTYLLHSTIIEKNNAFEYVFQTNRSTSKAAKTPRGLFADMYIPNDMLAVCNAITAYEHDL